MGVSAQKTPQQVQNFLGELPGGSQRKPRHMRHLHSPTPFFIRMDSKALIRVVSGSFTDWPTKSVHVASSFRAPFHTCSLPLSNPSLLFCFLQCKTLNLLQSRWFSDVLPPTSLFSPLQIHSLTFFLSSKSEEHFSQSLRCWQNPGEPPTPHF